MYTYPMYTNSDGCIITPEELVDFTSSAKEAEFLRFQTMAYRPSRGPSEDLHTLLLDLASNNTEIAISVDAGYGLRISPGTDAPIYLSNPLGLLKNSSLET